MAEGRLEANGAMGLTGSDWNADDIAIPLYRVGVGVVDDSYSERCRVSAGRAGW